MDRHPTFADQLASARLHIEIRPILVPDEDKVPAALAAVLQVWDRPAFEASLRTETGLGFHTDFGVPVQARGDTARQALDRLLDLLIEEADKRLLCTADPSRLAVFHQPLDPASLAGVLH